MTTSLLARKGEAVPSGLSGNSRHAHAYFAARRTIAFGQAESDARRDPVPAITFTLPARPRPAASILFRQRGQSDDRRRFTFRLDHAAHERLCAAADALGCSRQKLLERALDRFLDVTERLDIRPAKVMPAVPRLL